MPVLRPRAVRSILLDVAALRPPADAAGTAHGDPGERDDPGDAHLTTIRHAARRALLVAAIDALAIALLFVLRDRSRSFLLLERSPDAVFTLGVLAVAVHLGFRLAQYRQLRRVLWAVAELPRDAPNAVADTSES